jgi:hypothetical protein
MGKKNKAKISDKSKTLNTSESERLPEEIPQLLPVRQNSDEVYISQGPNDLFEGVLVKSAISALSDEDKEKYRKLGQELYGKIDFENSKILSTNPDPIKESISYIESQLKSGIHPSMLEDTEKEIMNDFVGPEWYVSWGYTAEELNDFVIV